MFWRRKRGEKKSKQKKKSAARKIDGALWRYMVSQQHVSPDVLQSLRLVEREVVIGDKPVGLTMFRIFNPFVTDEKGVSIDVAGDDYESLDSHPESILFEGYYKPVAGEATNIHIEEKHEKGPGSGGK